MKPWTEAATQVLEEYLRHVRASLDRSEAEPEEVLDDIRRHVDEELRALNSDVVTEEAVRGVLRRMGPAVSPKELAAHMEPAPSRPRTGWSGLAPWLLAGVALPALSVVVELALHTCAEIFFDPLPTIWHVLLVSLVPAANLLVLVCLSRGRGRVGLLGFLNAAAIGVSAFYGLLFLPTAPLSVLGVLAMGIGLLPLSPYFALLSAVMLRRKLRAWTEDPTKRGVPWLRVGSCTGFLLLVVAQLPSTITRYGLAEAASEDPDVRARAIRLLRKHGDKEILLRACYDRSGAAGDLPGLFLGKPPTPERVRTVYYRVTGELYNSLPPPPRAGLRGLDPDREFTWDPDQGGAAVAGRLRGLSLSASRIDGTIDPDAAIAYLEWTLVFRNEATNAHEARTEISLPPDAAVSRVTLWIDGEEREAAFGSRRQVREAYEKVVRARRDPLLVTSRGRDRVLLQCFPVPPKGGEMKVRIGMTCPLALRTKAEGHLRLPTIDERNFSIPADLRHSIWIESPRSLQAGTKELVADRGKPDVWAVRGTVDTSTLSSEGAVLISTRDGAVAACWCPDANGPVGKVVRQDLVEEGRRAPGCVVLVVDGSRSMREYVPKTAEILERLPLGTEFAVLVASDEVLDVTEGVKGGTAETLREASSRLKTVETLGGCDNLPALVRAWEMACDRRNAAILWIHGPQPLLIGNAEELRQRWERRPGNPVLLDIQVLPGPNAILQALDRVPWIRRLPPLAGFARDIDHLLAVWRGEAKRLAWSRRQADRAEAAGKETSSHLARLWVLDRVTENLREGGTKRAEEATNLAVRYHLVTPVTGAVVLETKEQYQAAGLDPVSAETVPTVPEPGEWLLFAIACGLLLWMIRKKKTALRPA